MIAKLTESVINNWPIMTSQCQAVAVVQRGNVPFMLPHFEMTFRSKPSVSCTVYVYV